MWISLDRIIHVNSCKSYLRSRGHRGGGEGSRVRVKRRERVRKKERKTLALLQ